MQLFLMIQCVPFRPQFYPTNYTCVFRANANQYYLRLGLLADLC